MNEIKSYIKSFLWEGNSVTSFERWLYHQDLERLEKFMGSKGYLNIIGHDYRRTTISMIKGLLKENISSKFRKECDAYFWGQGQVIRGFCNGIEMTDYSDRNLTEWGVEAGKYYDFIMISTHWGAQDSLVTFVNYADRDDYLRPSGFIPAEMFDIDLGTIPELYEKKYESEKEWTIEPKAWSAKNYGPNEFSFLEDFYNDDEKAIEIYYQTLDDLGVKDIW